MTGDYLTDDIGSGYDLVLAIATLSFVEQEMAGLMKKLYKAMNPGGVLLCYSEGIERDGSGPWDMMLGWLPYNMQGYNLGVKKNEITEAAMAAGFRSAEKRTGKMCIRDRVRIISSLLPVSHCSMVFIIV